MCLLSQCVPADCPEDLGVSAWRARVRGPASLWSESQAELHGVSLQLFKPERSRRGGGQHQSLPAGGRAGAGGLRELSSPSRRPWESAKPLGKPLPTFLHWLPYSVSPVSCPESAEIFQVDFIHCRVSKDSSCLPPTYSSLNLSENISESPPPPPQYDEALKIGI